MNHRKFLVAISIVVLVTATGNSQDLASELREAAADLATTTYQLEYKFEEGEVIRYSVEHLVTIDTKISGNTQQTKSTTNSTKAWNVKSVDDDTIEFEHLVEDVQLWNKNDGRDEVRYDSKTDEEPPEEFKGIAETIGKTLATVTINRSGQVITRDKANAAPDLGFGGLLVPLPPKPVKLNHTWAVPKKLQLQDKDGRYKQVRIQMKYRLKKVQSGVATLSVKTEVLTPINDATLKSKLVQQISNGEIKFDIDAGRVMSKQLDWMENVIGFNGAGSNMKYLARFTETLVDTRTAKRDNATQAK